MAMNNRTMQVGLLTEMKQRRNVLSVEIDSAVRSILLHFEPLDMDLQYIERIMPDRLEILVAKVRRQKREFDRVQAEIRRLEGELGPNNV